MPPDAIDSPECPAISGPLTTRGPASAGAGASSRQTRTASSPQRRPSSAADPAVRPSQTIADGRQSPITCSCRSAGDLGSSGT